MNKIVLLASTVLTSAVLFSTVNISEAKADEVTANNAKHVAQQAMKTAVAIPTYRISTLSKIRRLLQNRH